MFKKKEKMTTVALKLPTRQKINPKSEVDKRAKPKAKLSSRGNDDVFVSKPPEPKKGSARKTLINNTIDVPAKVPAQKTARRKTSSTLVPKSAEKDYGSPGVNKKMNRAAIKIQKIWRGYWTRK